MTFPRQIFMTWAPLDIFDIFFGFLRCSRSGCMVNILSNQFRNVTFFWLKVARKMTKLKIALHGNLYFWIHESENAFGCIFFLWFIPLWQRKKKSLDRKYVLLRRADVKQKCRRVSIMRKKIVFHYFQDVCRCWLIIFSEIRC